MKGKQGGRGYLAVSAYFDWLIVIPRILEVLTHVEVQTTPRGKGGMRNRCTYIAGESALSDTR